MFELLENIDLRLEIIDEFRCKNGAGNRFDRYRGASIL